MALGVFDIDNKPYVHIRDSSNNPGSRGPWLPQRYLAFEVGPQSNNVRSILILESRALEVVQSLNLVDRDFSRCLFELHSGGYCTWNLMTVIL